MSESMDGVSDRCVASEYLCSEARADEDMAVRTMQCSAGDDVGCTCVRASCDEWRLTLFLFLMFYLLSFFAALLLCSFLSLLACSFTNFLDPCA